MTKFDFLAKKEHGSAMQRQSVHETWMALEILTMSVLCDSRVAAWATTKTELPPPGASADLFLYSVPKKD